MLMLITSIGLNRLRLITPATFCQWQQIYLIMTTNERDTNMNDFIKYMQDYLVKLEQEIVEFTDDYAKAIDEDTANQFMEDILMTSGEKNAVKHLLKKAEEVTK